MASRASTEAARLAGTAAQGQSFVRLAQLTKSFGDHTALAEATIDVREGEFLTLLGPSGCGKTTLLRIAAGFEQPDSGRVFFRGKDITPVPPERRPFNMVFQSYALFPHMSVEQNVSYGPQAAGQTSRQVRELVRQILELVNLDAAATRPVRQLSGGQQQRVALARALVNEPMVLLLDEPLAALDLKLRKHLQDELRSIQQRLRTTFIYVTHDQEEALRLSDRICLMNEGRIVQSGSPRELYRRPANRFAASFIGDSNILRCQVRQRHAQGVRVNLGSGSATDLWASDPGQFQENQDAWAVLRPEDLEISSPGSGHFEGLLTETVFLGSASRHEISLPEGTSLRVLTGPDHVAVPGSAVHLRIKPDCGVALPMADPGPAPGEAASPHRV